MVTSCCCYGCNEQYVKGGPVTFHSFPRDEQRAKIWLQKINRGDLFDTTFSKVCSKHFTKECFNRGKFGSPRIKRNAVPTVFDFPKYAPTPKGRGRKRQARSLSAMKGSSVSEDEILATIHRKYVPILPAPTASANGEGNCRVLYMLLPASSELVQTRPDDERSGNGSTRGGESGKVGSDSAAKKMEWGVPTKKKAGQSHCGENRDYSVCHTVNLKEAFADKLVKEEPVEDRREAMYSATGEERKYTSVKQEPVEDLDKPSCSATEQECECTPVKQEPACGPLEFPRLEAKEGRRKQLWSKPVVPTNKGGRSQECEYTFVKREPGGHLDEAICLATEEECECTPVKQEPACGPLEFPHLEAKEEFEYVEVKGEPLEEEDSTSVGATQWVW